MSKQRGFTLVELIVVIVILGILAATALPKFVDLSGDARSGVIRGVEGAMRGANTMLYGKATALGAQNSSTATISATNGISLTVAYGYASNATELAKVLDLNPASDFNNTGTAIQHNGAGTRSSCQVEYAAPTAAGGVPAYSATVTGC